MAQGWDRVEQTAQATAEQRARWADQSVPQLWLKSGESVTGRFLEQGPEIHNYAVHEYTVPNPNNPAQPYRRNFTCLNDREDGTPCPGCAAGMKRKIKGVFNLIQRNRPVLRKGQDGKAIKVNGQYITDGYQDDVVVWLVPSTTAEEVRKKDAAYNGLMTGDVTISKTGAQFQPYSIEPADIANFATPLSESDQALQAKKHDLDKFMAPPSFQEAAQIVAQHGGQATTAAPSGPQAAPGQASPPPASGQQPAEPHNPFMDETGPGAQQPAPAAS